LDGLSSSILRYVSENKESYIYGQDEALHVVTHANGLLLTERQWNDLGIGLLRECGLICEVQEANAKSPSASSLHRIIGLFQVYPITGQKLGLKDPLFLVTDSPSLISEDAVFPTYLFRTQFEYHLNQIRYLLCPGDRIIDVGTGAGAYALCCAKIGESLKEVVGIEVNPRALKMARLNRRLNGLDQIVQLEQADLFKFTPPHKYDLLISNPPYVAFPRHYQGSYYKWAYAGADGLTHLRGILRRAEEFLNRDGKISLVTYSLGSKRDSRIEEHLQKCLGKFHISICQRIFPPMWTAFNNLWFDQNPIHIDELYLRVRQFKGLAWIRRIWNGNTVKIANQSASYYFKARCNSITS
jgi:SAM-dependent methyltransferase